MFIRFLALLALLVPVAAIAQSAPSRDVGVEIVGSGTIEVPVTRFTVSVEISTTGPTQTAADTSRDRKRAEVVAALGRVGIPATALTEPQKPLDGPLSAKNSDMMVMTEATDPAEDGEKPSFTSNQTLVLELASVDQVVAARGVFAKLEGVTAGAPSPVVGDTMGAYRQAKAKALANARLDAEAYAKELGLRVQRVSKITEAGNGMFFPGFQTFFQRLMTAGGPQGLKGMFEGKPGTVRVDASIIVEFVLAP